MTLDVDHQELRALLGPYLLGGLDSGDRSRLESHLGTCPACERELARLAPVPGLLSRLRDQPEPSATEPPPGLLPRLVEESRRERRRVQRRAVLTTLAAAAAVIAIVVAGGLFVRSVDEPGTDDPAPTLVTLQTTGEYDAVGSASLTPKTWGTEMTLEVDAMPAKGPFRLEVTDVNGVSEVAASWGTTPSGAAVVSGATALVTEDLRSVRVVCPEGTVLEGRP